MMDITVLCWQVWLDLSLSKGAGKGEVGLGLATRLWGRGGGSQCRRGTNTMIPYSIYRTNPFLSAGILYREAHLLICMSRTVQRDGYGRPKLGSFDRSSLKRGAEVLEKSAHNPIMWEPFNYSAISYSNWQLGTELPSPLCSKVHTDPTAPLVLHCKRISKCALTKIGINCQLWSQFF